jgi:hypothetical protein
LFRKVLINELNPCCNEMNPDIPKSIVATIKDQKNCSLP